MIDRKYIHEKISARASRSAVAAAIEKAVSSYPEYVPGYVEGKSTGDTEGSAPTGKKKRAPSAYNIFIGKCMKAGYTMQDCAQYYRDNPSMFDEDGVSDEVTHESPPAARADNPKTHSSGDDDIDPDTFSSPKPSEIPHDQPEIVIYTDESCPECADLKDFLTGYIHDGSIIVKELEDLSDEEIDTVESVPEARVNGEKCTIERMDDGVHLRRGTEDVVVFA